MSQTRLLPPNGQVIKTLSEYKAIGGLKGLTRARSMAPKDVIEEIKAAKLRGRGGAGFPTFIKWAGVSSEDHPIKYIVCNGSEGEPGTYKDRYLLSKNAFPLVEGILIAKYAIGATKAYIGLKKKYTKTIERVQSAIDQLVQEGVCTSEDVAIFFGPDEYLFGEERALIEVLSGGGCMPRHAPTYLLGAKYDPTHYNPTVVNNIETLNHVTHILANGAEWFKSAGCEGTPGTTIFTLCGHVKRPGMYELPMGTSLETLLYEYGQGPRDEKYPLKAACSGVANTVMPASKFKTNLDFDSMKAVGSGLGSSGYLVYDQGTSMVEVALMMSAFLAKESCGQCMPCKIGCGNVTDLLYNIYTGRGCEADLERIRFYLAHITDQTRCFLSHEERIVIGSIMEHFPEDFQAHMSGQADFPHQAFLGKINYFHEESGEFELAHYDFPWVNAE